jgi:CRISPR/Cas system-associated protein Csm6
MWLTCLQLSHAKEAAALQPQAIEVPQMLDDEYEQEWSRDEPRESEAEKPLSDAVEAAKNKAKTEAEEYLAAQAELDESERKQ